ncbi:hypothetical protein M0R45_036193 [Rubus argutus]|uniref:Reverse transcriptase Ty1/copia-type domain-containing protein n=1 Tax=Rubus argutus TaxID=59490 RepID=A0AAW1W0V5_RUBAR
MTQPPGFEDPIRPHYVCKLHKSLYGLKQAPRAWYEELYHHLLSLGFIASIANTSLFYKFDNLITFLLVYVDDIVLTGSNPHYCQYLISQLSTKFSMKDLGPFSFFLGIEVTRTPSALYLSQAKYIHDLLDQTGMLDSKPCPCPTTSFKLDHTSGDLLHDPHIYWSIVGALQYLTWTRPDIAYPVNKVCQFMHSPRSTHLAAVKRILRYLKGTPDQGLQITKGDPILTIFTNADWGGCPIDRRTTTGYCVFLGNTLLSWSAKKQPTITRSSTEAEY